MYCGMFTKLIYQTIAGMIQATQPLRIQTVHDPPIPSSGMLVLE